MILKKKELATLLNVTNAAVSNWIKRKKIVVNVDKRINTEDNINRAFFMQRAPFLYEKDSSIDNIKQQNDKKDDIDLNNEDVSVLKKQETAQKIDDMTESEAKEYLKTILYDSPKDLLITAQYHKTKHEASLKRIEVLQKANLNFDRSIVDTYILSLLRIYYQNRRVIPYNSVDEIITLVLNDGLKARGKILKLLDDKFTKEVKDAIEKLKTIMNKDLKPGQVEDDYVNLELNHV